VGRLLPWPLSSGAMAIGQQNGESLENGEREMKERDEGDKGLRIYYVQLQDIKLGMKRVENSVENV
jgi:hypothetical protein